MLPAINIAVLLSAHKKERASMQIQFKEAQAFIRKSYDVTISDTFGWEFICSCYTLSGKEPHQFVFIAKCSSGVRYEVGFDAEGTFEYVREA